MAVIKTTVAKSNDIKDAALNLNAKAFEVRRTLAAVWNLKPTSTKPPPPAESFSLDMRNESGESVVGDGDERVKVRPEHFAPGGKYRSIVKLFIRYEFMKPNSWSMGTGWLVSPDILVTAGHCSYDWGHKMGRATEVKAYIGYYGQGSEKDPNVQFRHVKRIVTTEGWVKTKGQKAFDVSFMQVDTPFSETVPFKFDETPAKGNMGLGVVGYPGDLSDPATREKGAHMYEMFLQTEWDLATQSDTMLEYQIDTFGGNSGSPVLRNSDLVSIGAHVYGGTFNSASVIGKFGNPYLDYLAAFNLPVPNEGLNLIPVTGNTATNAPVPSGFVGYLPSSMTVSGLAASETPHTRNLHNSQGFSQAPGLAFSIPFNSVQPARAGASSRYSDALVKKSMHETDEEGFLDALKQAASVGLPFLGSAASTVLPIALGPAGGPISAIFSCAMNAAGKLCESAVTEGFTQDSQTIEPGSMERAILAEATLTALQSMELSPEAEESIFGDMKDTVMKALPTVRKVAPQVLGAMMEPALRIALNSLHSYNAKSTVGTESFGSEAAKPFRSTVVYTNAINRPVDPQAEQFLSLLQVALERNKEESAMDTESMIDFGNLFRGAVRLAGKGIATAAKHGLPLLLQGLASGTESIEDDLTPDKSRVLPADALAHRAIVAEAALQAVMKQSPQYLQEEGFIDGLFDAIKTIAPVVMPMLPDVVSAISPVVGNVVQNVLGQDSTPAINDVARDKKPRLNRLGSAAPPLRSQRSLASLRHHESSTGFSGPTYEGFGQRANASRGASRQNVNYSRPAY